MALEDWTLERTVSPPVYLTIAYKLDGQDLVATFQSTPTSEVTTEYRRISYLDREGAVQESDVALSRVSITSTTQAAVAGNYITYRLSNGLGLPSGNAEKVGSTLYEYWVDRDGPRLIKETTIEQISEVELAGSLAIEDFSDYEPSTGLVTVSRTEIVYSETTGAFGRVYTKSATTRWTAWGLTQEGQQAAAEMLKTVDQDGVALIVEAMKALVCDGTEVRSGIGRMVVPVKPNDQEIAADEIENPPLADEDSGTNSGNYNPSKGSSSQSFSFANTLDLLGNPDPGLTQFPGRATRSFPLVETAFRNSRDRVIRDPDSFAGDSNSDGVPDWAAFVPPSLNWEDFTDDEQWKQFIPTAPQSFAFPSPEDYAVDTDSDGVPDWAQFVPEGEDWEDYVAGDQWIDLVPGTFLPQEPKTGTFVVPLAPDDYFEIDTDGERQLIRGSAETVANRYGELENALRYGHANGFNLTSDLTKIPADPMSSISLTAYGVVGTFMCNGTAWEFDARSGWVVSTDAMLLGAAGIDPSWPGSPQAWFEVPAPLSFLQEIPALGEEDTVLANSVPIYENFDPLDPGTVFQVLPFNGEDVAEQSFEPDYILTAYTPQQSFIVATEAAVISRQYPYVLMLQNLEEVILGSSAVVIEIMAVPVARSVTRILAPEAVGMAAVRPPAARSVSRTLPPMIPIAPGDLVWTPDMTGATYADDGRTMTRAPNNGGYLTLTAGSAQNSGKWYFEALINSSSGAEPFIGLAPEASGEFMVYFFSECFVAGLDLIASSMAGATVDASAFYASGEIGAGRVIMLAVDFDAKKAWVGRDGTWNEGSPVAGTGPMLSGWTDTQARFPSVGILAYAGGSLTIPEVFAHQPSGFDKWPP